VSDTLGVFGKLGAFNWELDYTCGKVSGTGGACTTPSASPSGTDLVYGIGMKYDFTKQTGLRVEWEQYKNIGDKNVTGEGDVDLISVGIQFKF
jgi:OOP family OmpA-OmpF porin